MDTAQQEALATKDAEIERLKKENEDLNEKLKKLTKQEIERSFPENLFECPVCCFPYSKRWRIPVIGKCGHTICGQCAQSISKMKTGPHCPICRAKDSFAKALKNFLACEFLEEIHLIGLSVLLVNQDPPQGTILVLGGIKNDQGYGGMMLLSNNRDRWIEIDVKLSWSTAGSGAVCLNGEIYLIGGEENPRALYKLNKYLKWIRLVDMNIGRQWITNSCVAWNGYIWVFGGSDENACSRRSVERYDPKENKWTEMPPMKYPRMWAAAAVWNDRIVISGGIHDSQAKINVFEAFQDDHWTEMTSTPSSIHSHILVSYKNKLITMGGLNVDRNTSEDVWEFDPINSTWKKLMSMQVPTDSFAGVVLKDDIYAIGGWQGSDEKSTARVEIFDGEGYLHGPRLPYAIRNMSAMIIPQYLANRLCHYDDFCIFDDKIKF